MATQEDWETSSGLSLDGATVEIVDCEFGFNANIGAGVVCCNMTLQPDDGSEAIEQSFSVGGKFEASRDGSTLEGNGKPNKNSNFGLLIESIKDVVDEPWEVIGTPKEAACWVGLIFTFGTVEREVRNPTSGESKMSSKFVVTEFHGRAGDDEPKAKGKTATSKKAAPKAAPAKKAASNDVDAELFAQLVELANEYDDHAEFVEAALEVEGVEGNRAAQKAIMTTKDGSVWAAKEDG